MSLRRRLLHNFGWKLFSFCLAIVIWMIIHFSIHNPVQANAEQRSIHVPISVNKLPDDARIYRITPDQVEVLLGGDEAVLRGMDKSNIKLYIDLTEIHSVQTTAMVHADVPGDVTVIQINPVAVNIEQIPP